MKTEPAEFYQVTVAVHCKLGLSLGNHSNRTDDWSRELAGEQKLMDAGTDTFVQKPSVSPGSKTVSGALGTRSTAGRAPVATSGLRPNERPGSGSGFG